MFMACCFEEYAGLVNQVLHNILQLQLQGCLALSDFFNLLIVTRYTVSVCVPCVEVWDTAVDTIVSLSSRRLQRFRQTVLS